MKQQKVSELNSNFLIGNYTTYPIIAAAFIKDTEILIEKSTIAEDSSPLEIRSPIPKVKRSVSLKQSNCKRIAMTPQINISTIELLTINELASGIAIPRRAPENDIAAAMLPDFIRVISFIGVTKMYRFIPQNKRTIVKKKWIIKKGKPEINASTKTIHFSKKINLLCSIQNTILTI